MSRKQAKKEQKQKKGHKALKIILTILVIILVIIGGFVSYSTYKNGWGWQGILATMMGHDQETLKEMEELRILLLGVSKDIDSELTDTIMVASYNPKNQTATLLSIPRDTFIGKNKTSADSYDKINALYQKGADKTLKAVNDITGLGIKYYAVIDNQALIDTVDAIGGVDFEVPIKMKYDDPTQDLHIDLEPGMQRINGEKAEQLLRFRHNNNGSSYSAEYGDNDVGRMRTQREFIMETVRQTLQLKNIIKLGELMDIVYKNVDTNIKLSDVKDYLPYAIDFNTENIKTGVLPGEPAMINKLYFFEHNKTQTEKLIQELFYSTNETTSDESSAKENNTTTSSTTKVPTSETSKIKIELLNGSGDSKVLTEVTNLLKKKGYNVYKTGTAATNSKTTIINNADVKESILTNVKELLKTGTISSSATSSDSKADVTIIIGKDYK